MQRWRSNLLPLLVASVLCPASGWGGNEPSFNFMLNCAGCHQSDGTGLSDGTVPSFHANLGHFVRIPEGREFVIQVPGSSQSALDDDELAAVLNWMLDEFCRSELPRAFEPYTAAEVHRLRAIPLSDVKLTRARIIANLREAGYDVR